MGESSDALMAMWFAREMFVNHGGGSRGSIRHGKNPIVSSGDIVGEIF